MMNSLIFVFYFLIQFTNGDKLVLVQLMMRHGDRTPATLYPNDNNTEDTWPQGLGQLTKLGIKQQYNVGKYLRKRYVSDLKYLSPTYQRKELLVQSSHMDRTLMSATSTLQGLYPEKESALWDPIPVHTAKEEHDMMLYFDSHCDKFDDAVGEVLRSDYGTQYIARNREFIHDVCLAAGWKNASLWNVWDTEDCITIEARNNRTLPPWATKPVIDKLKEVYVQKVKFYTRTEEQRKIRSGLFLTEIRNRTEAKISGTMPDDKMFLYFTHDSNLASVLSSLGVWDEKMIPLSSIIIFELYETPEKDHKIVVRYKNNSITDPMGDPVTLTLPDCTEACPIDQFYEQIKPHLLNNEEAWIAYCQYWGEGHITRGGIVAVSIFCTLFLIGLIVLFYWCYRHQQAEVRYLPTNYGVSSNM